MIALPHQTAELKKILMEASDIALPKITRQLAEEYDRANNAHRDTIVQSRPASVQNAACIVASRAQERHSLAVREQLNRPTAPPPTRADCLDCLDGEALSDTCDQCDARHCPYCEECTPPAPLPPTQDPELMHLHNKVAK